MATVPAAEVAAGRRRREIDGRRRSWLDFGRGLDRRCALDDGRRDRRRFRFRRCFDLRRRLDLRSRFGLRRSLDLRGRLRRQGRWCDGGRDPLGRSAGGRSRRLLSRRRDRGRRGFARHLGFGARRRLVGRLARRGCFGRRRDRLVDDFRCAAIEARQHFLLWRDDWCRRRHFARRRRSAFRGRCTLGGTLRWRRTRRGSARRRRTRARPAALPSAAPPARALP